MSGYHGKDLRTKSEVSNRTNLLASSGLPDHIASSAIVAGYKDTAKVAIVRKAV